MERNIKNKDEDSKVIVKLKKIDDSAITPAYSSNGAAGIDLYSIDNVTINPGETVKIHTGICMELPSGYVGIIAARSGLGINKGLSPANKIGVIDEDYRGEVIVALHNDSQEQRIINSGDRIAQMLIIEYNHVEFEIVDELSDTVRGEGKFGSTGK